MLKIFKFRVKSLVYTNLSLNPQHHIMQYNQHFVMVYFFFSLLYLIIIYKSCDQTFIYSFLRKYRNMIINLLPLWVNLSFSFFLFKLKTDSSYIPTKDFSSSTPSIQTSLSLSFVSAPSSSPLEQVSKRQQPKCKYTTKPHTIRQG